MKDIWADPSKYIQHIHVAEDVIDNTTVKDILERVDLPYSIVATGEEPQGISGVFPGNLHLGKKHLYLCNNKGHFFKPCPGTLEYSCCGYHVLNIGMNCPIDCVYCILQAYLDKPWISSFVNREKMYEELTNELSSNPDRFYRIGTGEFTDSLAIDRITGLNEDLVTFMGQQDNVLFELKSKCTYIDPLKTMNHQGKTLISWSLNSEIIQKKEELRGASLDARFRAARKVVEWGYGLAFHFDPIVVHKNWREGYKKTIERLFREVPGDAIVWISLGALRFLPQLKNIATSRFPKSKIFYNEFITGLDNKSRYFRQQREEMYLYIYELLKERVANDTCIYFCMESEDVWQKVMGFTPEEYGGISAMLDRASRAFLQK